MKKMSFMIVMVLVSLVLSLSIGSIVSAQDVPEAINVGAVIPLTGAFAGGGAQVERGYQFAVDAINAEGGVFVEEFGTRIPINLIVRDDESDPGNTVAQLESLFAEEDVTAYLGGFGSSLHAAAAAIAEKNQVPYLGVAFALWDIHQQGFRYLFSPFPKSPDLARDIFVFLNELPEDERPLRVGILQESTDWGIELGNLWVENAEANGYEVVVHETYTPLNQDFTDLILQLQENDVQLLLSLPIPPDGITLYRQMAELGYTPAASLAIRAPDVPTWVDLGAAGDLVMLMPGWHNSLGFAGVEALNERHIEEFGRPADPQVGPAFTAVMILADAIERAGTLDRDAIRDAIAETNLEETPIGPISFNEDGTGVTSSPILQYQNGVTELVWPDEFATADFIYPAPPVEEREFDAGE